MKISFTKYISIPFLCMSMQTASLADAVYPYSNPTYTPTAVSPLTAMTIGAANYTMRTNDIGLTTIRIIGTCSSLAATVKVSNETTSDATFTAVYVMDKSTNFTSSTITAAGLYAVNTTGMAQVQLAVTALSVANCSVAMAGTSSTIYAPVFDPCTSPYQCCSCGDD
jgi:hypothetical protein